MTTKENFTESALSFQGTEQKPHFDRIAFKVVKKRTFATYHEPSHTANLKLSLTDQSTFCDYGKDIIYPVPNKWGEKGWTTFELNDIPNNMMTEALLAAYNDVFSAKKTK